MTSRKRGEVVNGKKRQWLLADVTQQIGTEEAGRLPGEDDVSRTRAGHGANQKGTGRFVVCCTR